MKKNPREQLRKLMEKEGVQLPGAYNAITAKLIKKAGHKAIYISGGGLSAAAGLPDIGLLTLQEFLTFAKYIVAATDLPCLCDADTGFDYIFTRMNAIYGATFANHWREVDPDIIRQIWKESCGTCLTYRPKMDYALKNMNPDRPPSALAFAKLLIDGPSIPVQQYTAITKQLTQEERVVLHEAKSNAMERLKELSKEMKMK